MQQFLKDNSQLQNVCLIPSKKINNILWDSYGGLLEVLSKILGIESAIALSILSVESSGKGFENERMIIRFENHKFWKYWGINHQTDFMNHFKFDLHEPWRHHAYRKTPKDAWVYIHLDSQNREWEAFNAAYKFDVKAAVDSISMGIPQIMGFNFARIGYESEVEMFTSFSNSEQNQIIGLFDFIGIGSKMCDALQNKNFLRFAILYNGSGSAEEYSERIEKAYKSFSTLLKE